MTRRDNRVEDVRLPIVREHFSVKRVDCTNRYAPKYTTRALSSRVYNRQISHFCVPFV